MLNNLSPSKLINIKINNVNIKWTNTTKYRGVTLDPSLSLISHVNSVISKTKCARASLYPTINRNSKIPLKNRLSIFKIYIKPLLLYASPAWLDLINLTN